MTHLKPTRKTLMYNEHDSLTSHHKINLNGLIWLRNQSINLSIERLIKTIFSEVSLASIM